MTTNQSVTGAKDMKPNRFDLDVLQQEAPNADSVLSDESIYEEIEHYYEDLLGEIDLDGGGRDFD